MGWRPRATFRAPPHSVRGSCPRSAVARTLPHPRHGGGAFLAKGDDSPPVDGALSTREVADALGREPGWGAARVHAEARA